jgi:preprotein translocase subunit SecY
MLATLANCWRIPELRARILATVTLVFIARIGANIPLPGVDPRDILEYYQQMADKTSGGVVAMYNMFTGGALLKGAIFSLGIMPYISASIILQLMTAVVPSLARLQQEGELGRQKIAQYSRYLTILIALVQSALLLGAFCNPQSVGSALGLGSDFRGVIVVMENQALFVALGVALLTAGSVIMLWLGEQITQRGIGNGVSLIITIGILADIPGAAAATYQLFFAPVGTASLGLPQAVLMIALFLIVTMGIVMVTQGQRKIPVQYAKRVVGQKVYGGQSSFLPLKVNYSGVMPVIFASAILLFPQQIFSQLGAAFDIKFLIEFSNNLLQGHWVYYVTMALLILFFSYFWVSVMFKPIQVADDLKKYGGYIPGVRPGEPTASFLDFVMTRLTLAGAIFLTVIAIIPDLLLFNLQVPPRIAYFFGGTGMLITVGVILDTMRQIETFLLQRHYDGFLKKGRIRGRSTAAQVSLGEAASDATVMKLVGFMVVMLVVGLAAWAVRHYSQ